MQLPTSLPSLPPALQARLDALTGDQKQALATGAAVAAGAAAAYGLYRVITRPPRAGPYPPDSLPAGAYDVAIVGAGPAGAAAAFYAARGGVRRVVLMDRDKFPRDKVCGDSVCAPALPILDDMGVLEELRRANEARPIETAGLVSPAGISYVGRCAPPGGGVVVKRATLDARLVRAAAAQSGVTLREGYEVDAGGVAFDVATGLWTLPAIKGRGPPLRARLLILADGASSSVSAQLGLVTAPPAAAGARVSVRDNRGKAPSAVDALRVYRRDALPGFVALARRADGEATLRCVLAHGDAAAAALDVALKTDSFLAAALGANPKRTTKIDAAPLRVGRQGVARVAAHHVLSVGDAAGAGDPLSGAGVHAALAGGRLAGQHAAAMVACGDFSRASTGRYAAAAAATVTRAHARNRRRAAAIARAPILLDAAAAEVRRGGDAALARWAGVAGGGAVWRPDVAVQYAVAAFAAAARGGGGRVGGVGGVGAVSPRK